MTANENMLANKGFALHSPDYLTKTGFDPYGKIGSDWFLVTAGDEKGYNTMTASWGFAGVMWNKNTFTTVIRPQRYTKEFIDKVEHFTICFFDEQYRKALSFCGSHSGRDRDKAAETGLTPMFFDGVTAFEQAKLVLVCKKAYVQPMAGECYLDNTLLEQFYAAGDHHVQYIGIVEKVYVKE